MCCSTQVTAYCQCNVMYSAMERIYVHLLKYYNDVLEYFLFLPLETCTLLIFKSRHGADEEMIEEMETGSHTCAPADCCSIDHMIGQYIAPFQTLSPTIRKTRHSQVIFPIYDSIISHILHHSACFLLVFECCSKKKP